MPPGGSAEIKLLEELRRPEHWGLSPDDVVVRAVQPVAAESRVLVAGVSDENRALLYLAAHGCDVTALAERRGRPARARRGRSGRARRASARQRATGSAAGLPTRPLTAVIYTPAAFAGLGAAERARVIEVLQSATEDGGVHLVQTIAAGKRAPVSLDELRRRYRGWDVTVDEGGGEHLPRSEGASLSSMFLNDTTAR